MSRKKTRRQLSVDGLPAQTAPQALTLSTGTHKIAEAPHQAGAPGTQCVFTIWNIRGSQPLYHCHCHGHHLHGQLQDLSPATGSFFDVGLSVTVAYTPATLYTFISRSDAMSGTANPTSITPTGPESITRDTTVSATRRAVPRQRSFRRRHAAGRFKLRWRSRCGGRPKSDRRSGRHGLPVLIPTNAPCP